MFITVSDSQLHAKLLEMENIAEERLKAIADLETQKFDLVQGIHSSFYTFFSPYDSICEISLISINLFC